MSQQVEYVYMQFGPGKMQSGIVVALPPSPSCPIPGSVVAYVDELHHVNPSVYFRHGMTTLGMLQNTALAIQAARYGEFKRLLWEIDHFIDAAHIMGITIEAQDLVADQYTIPVELKDFLFEELSRYEAK